MSASLWFYTIFLYFLWITEIPDIKLFSVFFVLSVALAWNGNHFAYHKGNNSYDKCKKMYYFRIKLGMVNWCLFHIWWIIKVEYYKIVKYPINISMGNKLPVSTWIIKYDWHISDLMNWLKISSFCWHFQTVENVL